MHAPDGELLSCEEISEAGADQPSAIANCAMLGARLERGICPPVARLGQCLAMDGPDLAPIYPIRIHYYRSPEVPTVDVARRLCAELSGAFTPEP
jgi:hypothetical protein